MSDFAETQMRTPSGPYFGYFATPLLNFSHFYIAIQTTIPAPQVRFFEMFLVLKFFCWHNSWLGLNGKSIKTGRAAQIEHFKASQAL